MIPVLEVFITIETNNNIVQTQCERLHLMLTSVGQASMSEHVELILQALNT